LRHQADSLQSCGIRDIRIVTGYGAKGLQLDGLKVIHNPDFASTGAAYSILSALDKVDGDCLVLYSDIIFDRQILQQLLTSPYEATIVIDRAYQTLPFRDKKLDLVTAQDASSNSKVRDMRLNTYKPVQKIGCEIDPQKANYEFAGMALFRSKALKALRDAWKESPMDSKADFNELIQHMIDKQYPVYGFEISHGWSEIHSMEDYRRVCTFYESPVH
jgi:choline kinase